MSRARLLLCGLITSAILCIAVYSAKQSSPPTVPPAPVVLTPPATDNADLPSIATDMAAFHMHAAVPRSGKWPKVRADHLAAHPCCEVCGRKGTAAAPMQVHHVKDFKDFPEYELLESNLITLCGPEGCGAHFWLGHLGNYKLSNPHVREDAALLKKRYADARK